MLSIKRKPRKPLPLLAALLAALTSALMPALPAPALASTYITAEGDTIAQIAAATGCDAGLLSAINGAERETPLAGGLLLTLADEPVLKCQVRPGDTLYGLARTYGCDPAQLAAVNELQPPYLIFPGQSLLLPLAEEQSCWPGTAAGEVIADPAALTAALAPAAGFAWPAQGVITSPFGPRDDSFHYGLDIAVASGTPVKAAAAGRVLEAGWKNEGYGYAVLIDHENGMLTLYGHCSAVEAAPGQWVEQGETVALSGSTGRSTGPHLHFEVRLEGEPRDPLEYLPEEGRLL